MCALFCNIVSDTWHQLYAFTIIAETSAGPGVESDPTYARTTTSSLQFGEVMIIIGVCVFAGIAAIGFVYEYRFGTS